jgi:CHAT domain-containing protein
LVTYWVAPDATYIWVVPSRGEIANVRVDVTERRLAELVRRTWTIDGRSRGAPAPAPGPAQATPDSAVQFGDADRLEAGWTPRVRGEDLLSFGNDARVALRALDGLLIQPIRRLLPPESGSLLTIIPHGPLFLLSFAALQNPAGQYLIEHHAIHYVPAGVVLQLAEEHKIASPPVDDRYLLVADPRTPPPLPGGKQLPPLPGTRNEISQVARLLPASRVTTAVGAEATEDRVRRIAGDRRVIHFATHGVIRTDDPLESFLALEVPAPGAARITGPTWQNDGRLTVREIYDIDLNADLVVLSACRTGLGPVSGDGVAGLARAFLYAGTPSVVATLWDVADEPAALLMPTFYGSLRRTPDKAQALRTAQLRLLKALRAGGVKVAGTLGPVTLREHPVLWAGFIVVGRP